MHSSIDSCATQPWVARPVLSGCSYREGWRAITQPKETQQRWDGRVACLPAGGLPANGHVHRTHHRRGLRCVRHITYRHFNLRAVGDCRTVMGWAVLYCTVMGWAVLCCDGLGWAGPCVLLLLCVVCVEALTTSGTSVRVLYCPPPCAPSYAIRHHAGSFALMNSSVGSVYAREKRKIGPD